MLVAGIGLLYGLIGLQSDEGGMQAYLNFWQILGSRVLIAVTEPAPARDPCSVASCVSTCRTGFPILTTKRVHFKAWSTS
ncbi:MAG: hypothetical protein CM15mP74_11900 [Halieaceae bacterium]|nr:MAG: hypothetical protein CM15mP74_11900 [Halieaceae bacterium]